MGAEYFEIVVPGRNPQTAFQSAVDSYIASDGNAGYTGTIAEKQTFSVVKPPERGEAIGGYPTLDQARSYAGKVARASATPPDEGTPDLSDKWGPAGCIEIGKARERGYTWTGRARHFLFFGWASS